MVCKASENSEKRRSQYPRSKGDIIKCLLLSDQNSKTQKYLINYNVRPRTAANSHTWEPGTIKCVTFLLKKWLQLLIV